MGIGRNPITVVLMGETHLVATKFAAESDRPKCVGIVREKIGDQEFAAALRRLADAKTVRAASVRIVLPRHLVTTRVEKFPSTDRSEIARMIHLESDRYVPYPVDELVLDFAVLDTTSDGFSTVLIVLVRRDEIDDILDALRGTHVKDISVTISSLAIYNAYRASGVVHDTHAAVVHVGVGGLDVIAVDNGNLAFMRGVPWSGDWQALAPITESVGTDIIREVRASVDSRRRSVPGGSPLAKLYLSGETPGLDTLRERLAAELHIEVEMLGVAPRGEAEAGAIAAGAVIPASRVDGGIDVNLVPEDYMARLSRSAQRRRIAVAAVLAMAVMLLAVRVSRERAEVNQQYLDYLRAEIKKIEPVKKLVQTKQQRVRAVHSQLSRNFTVLDFLAKIHDLAPDNMVFENISFTQGDHALIKAVARDNKIPFVYVDRLRKSGAPYLARAEVGTTGVTSQRGQTVIGFEVIIPFASEEESTDALEGEPIANE